MFRVLGRTPPTAGLRWAALGPGAGRRAPVRRVHCVAVQAIRNRPCPKHLCTACVSAKSAIKIGSWATEAVTATQYMYCSFLLPFIYSLYQLWIKFGEHSYGQCLLRCTEVPHITDVSSLGPAGARDMYTAVISACLLPPTFNTPGGLVYSIRSDLTITTYSQLCLTRSRIIRILPRSKVYTKHLSFIFYCFLPHISRFFSKSKLFLQSQEIRLRQSWLYKVALNKLSTILPPNGNNVWWCAIMCTVRPRLSGHIGTGTYPDGRYTASSVGYRCYNVFTHCFSTWNKLLFIIEWIDNEIKLKFNYFVFVLSKILVENIYCKIADGRITEVQLYFLLQSNCNRNCPSNTRH